MTSCGGGGKSTGEGVFQLIEFLESGQAEIPRNRILTFRFSAPVGATQDFPERLKIENVQTGANSNFSRAIGIYVITAEEVTFVPRLPTVEDRTNAGFKPNGNYIVFLKGGPDALRSAAGSPLSEQQEFAFFTNEFFEDPVPDSPPRVLGVTAIDQDTGANINISRLDPRPNELALRDSNDLITAGALTEPNQLEIRVRMSEPMDPATITNARIELVEIFANATESGDLAPPSASVGHFGDIVNFPVPIAVRVEQAPNAQGDIEVDIVVTPLGLMVDNTRYRLSLSGAILGLDFRQTFIGENGLTGDGQTELAGGVYEEPGGLGYVTEFIIRDRQSQTGTRLLTYDPLVDGIQPEQGQTSLDEDFFNRASYNTPSNPGVALGFVGAFGSGSLGPLNVSNGTFTIDTGDTPNDSAETPFTVNDLDPADVYKNTAGAVAPGTRDYDPPLLTEFDYESINIGQNGVLRIIGVNGARLLSAGIVSVEGTIDAAGGAGEDGVMPTPAAAGGTGADANGGIRGPGGYPGGFARRGRRAGSTTSFGGCNSFDTWISVAGGRPGAFPNSMHGEGPGRGMAGGEVFIVNQQDATTQGDVGGGGGGGSHATAGTWGEDKFNNGSAGNPTPGVGTIGKCSRWGIAKSLVIGVRGAPGTVYGDREAQDFTGGSGGGAGGAVNGWNHVQNSTGSGGGGGGGGGFLEVVSVGQIIVSGVIDVSGGAGGAGDFFYWTGQSWSAVSGGGGAGSGGKLSLISGSQIDLTNAMLDARGGAGGPVATVPSGFSGSGCTLCNAGGAGGKGFIFLMDADGIVTGFNPGPPAPGAPQGEFDNYEFGVLTIRAFDALRFGGSDAVTELFSVRVPNPVYTPIAPTDIMGLTNPGQTIAVEISSASPDPANPTTPDLTSEIGRFTVAMLSNNAGATVVEVFDKGLGTVGDIVENLNVPGERSSYVRVVAKFNYATPEEAALGPFLEIGEFILSFDFN